MTRIWFCGGTPKLVEVTDAPPLSSSWELCFSQAEQGRWWSNYISPEVFTVGLFGIWFVPAHFASPWLLFVVGEGKSRLNNPSVCYPTIFYFPFNSRFLPGSKQSGMAIPHAKDGRWGWQPDCPSPKQVRMWVGIHCEISGLGGTQGTVGFSLCSIFHSCIALVSGHRKNRAKPVR